MRRICPTNFTERLTRAGGLNKYGQPVFKLVWGESESMRVGGYFVRDGFIGYRDMPSVGREACWVIMIWEPAEMYGTADRWYRDYRDEVTGLAELGQYPYQGRYRVLQKLIHREFVNGEVKITRLEPSSFILDIMLPLIMRWQRLTNEAKVKAIEQEMALKEREYLNTIKDSRAGYRVKRSSSLVQKKVEFLERNMKEAMRIASRTQLGMRQES
jgi:hypothetical protein